MKVLKFGGTSMATAGSVRRVESLVRRDECAKYIVVSAPGKRFDGDEKVTDLLLAAHAARENSEECDALLRKVRARFCDIVRGLSLDFDLNPEFDTIRRAIYGGESAAYTASRGEFLSARITAKLLNATFIDAADLIRFDGSGNFDGEATGKRVRACLRSLAGRVVVPGFYGGTEKGEIKTFARGGSDITGAIIASDVPCSVYENWTDVDGFMAADPHLRPDARVIDLMTYEELRVLSGMGATVLHPDSILPVQESDIPIRIRNTFNPDAAGTLIVSSARQMRGEAAVIGIAGKRGFADGFSRIVLVGHGVRRTPDTVAAALKKAGIPIRRMDCGESELYVSVDVTNGDYEKAVDVLYDAFI